jgi:phage N-6-adenine-methyltransferase
MPEKNMKYISMCDSQEWGTPDWLYEPLNEIFHFDYDVCANHNNHKADSYFTMEDNCLTRNWRFKTGWMNPPYSRELKSDPLSGTIKYVQKAFLEVYATKNCETMVLLVPNATENKYYHDYIFCGKFILFLKGRVSFIVNGKPRSGNTKGSVLAFFSRRDITREILKVGALGFGSLIAL